MAKRQAFTTAALAALATAAGVSAAQAQTPPAPTHTTSWTGTVGEDRFGDARFKMRGRFQYDMADSEWDSGIDDGFTTYVRRAFLGVQGRLTENWRYKVDFVLDGGASNNLQEVAYDDAFLEYVSDNWSIVIGEHNITSPLEDRISSLDIPFIERSGLINSQGYGRLAGIGFIAGGANWHLSLAAQGDSLNDSSAQGTDDQSALSGRFTFAPIYETTPEGTTLVHLGVHVRQRDANEDSVFSYSTRPQNGRSSTSINAGVSADRDFSYGLEAAAQFGAFGATAQWGRVDAEEADGDEFEQTAYYVDVYWSLTGESRVYRGNQGSFAAIAPVRPLGTEGGIGHWMLSGRYDVTDLSDGPGTLAGEQTAYGVGLDWVPVDHVRFKLNYALSEIDYADPLDVDDEAQIVTLRTQFDF